MPADAARAPKVWRGRFYEDFEIGDVFRSRLGRTVTETDNIWFTCLTMNTNQIHFNVPYAERTQFGRPLVNSMWTLSTLIGLSVAQLTQGTLVAQLGLTDVSFPAPLFVGDTLTAETEVVSVRPSASRPGQGVVVLAHTGCSQNDEVVVTATRTVLVWTKDGAA